MSIRKTCLSGAALAFLSLAGLAASTGGASAYVVCNRDNDCWHSDTRYRYPGAGYVYHPDDWYFHSWDASRYHWHDYHTGRGYWRGGVWVTF